MGYPQRAKVEYPGDYLTAPEAEWELFAHSDEFHALEGINFVGDEVWLVDVARGFLLRAVDGRLEVACDTPGNPNGMRLIDERTLLVADRTLGVCTYDIVTGEYEVRVTGADGEPFGHLDDVAIDGRGGAYFTDPRDSHHLNPDGRIYYVRYGDGSFETECYLGGIAYPNGIVVSPDGMYVYIAEFNENAIVCAPSKLYDDDKDKPYVMARLTGGLGPDGLTVDSRGNVYAAHLHAGEVAVVDPKGWPVGELRLPAEAGILNTNLCIRDGYLYTCTIDHGDIWRIPVNVKPHVW